MSKYLVTARGGAGKTTIHKILEERGYNSFDTDNIPGLARWEDLATGQRVQVDPGSFVDYSKVGWNWNKNILRGILATRKNLFLCGSASNQLDFHELFDRVYVLTLDPEIHEQRLMSRESEYGKEPRMVEWLLNEQPVLAAKAIELGAVAIDATQPAGEIVDEIVRLSDV
jgi:broad-specificity NMP kinase